MRRRSRATKQSSFFLIVTLAISHASGLVGCGGPEYRPAASSQASSSAAKGKVGGEQASKSQEIVIAAGGNSARDSAVGQVGARPCAVGGVLQNQWNSSGAAALALAESGESGPGTGASGVEVSTNTSTDFKTSTSCSSTPVLSAQTPPIVSHPQ